MSAECDQENKPLSHHEQLPLCTTRLPYRQGRKLTAVKVYTITNESNHLLVFGVPSLNLRQETKAMFAKFGKMIHITISKNLPAEEYTETYHVRYERIRSARIAKRMTDTKNFYGGSLHVCYAPEYESLEETRSKLMQRKKDVTFRLRNLQKESESQLNNTTIDNKDSTDNDSVFNADLNIDNYFIANEVYGNTHGKKMNMGEDNVIYLNKTKRKVTNKVVIEKRFKPCFEDKQINKSENSKDTDIHNSIEVIDCTSVEKDIVSNINDALNYNKFGNEIVRKVEEKPVNRIIFKCNKKS